MANEHLVVCGPLNDDPRKRSRSGRTHAVRIGAQNEQVHLKIEHLRRPMAGNPPALITDLLELAAYVYVADQLSCRGGTKEFEYGEDWRRKFQFQVPVRCPDQWNRPEVQTALRAALHFLTDDDYEFEFDQHPHPPPLQSYLLEPSADEPNDYEEVLLFSGGLDSLGGAAQEIVQGRRKAVLVSHRASTKLYSRQSQLVQKLNQHVNERRLSPLHVAIDICKTKDYGRYQTQRSRSFVYSAIGAATAKMLGRDRVRFFENGITSLNLPLGGHDIGGRASRTTHPKSLALLGEFLSQLFERPFRVENPFQNRTKTEIVQLIAQAGLGPLCALTISCGHTIDITTAHSHCGACSQCLERWLTARAAGLDPGNDPDAHYKTPVLISPRSGVEHTLIERTVALARRIRRMKSATEFLSEFGEVARAIPHLGLAAQEAAQKLFDLHRRHAEQICGVLEEIVHDHIRLLVDQQYPADSLLGIAIGKPLFQRGLSQENPSPPLSADGPVVREEDFSICYRGLSCPLRNTLQFRLARLLLQRFGKAVSYSTIGDVVWGDDETESYAIQRVVSDLRRKLVSANMGDLLIDGTNSGHYTLSIRTPVGV